MAIRTQTGVLALALAAGLAACSDSALPTAPTATAASPVESAPTAPRVGQPVNGSVSDSALRPVAGARVELLDGPQAGVWTTTDARGAFTLFGTVDDTTRFRASKEGVPTRKPVRAIH